MWKDAANPWGRKKISSTGGVREKNLFSTGGKIGKIFPHLVFHIVTKRGGIVENKMQGFLQEKGAISLVSVLL